MHIKQQIYIFKKYVGDKKITYVFFFYSSLIFSKNYAKRTLTSLWFYVFLFTLKWGGNEKKGYICCFGSRKKIALNTTFLYFKYLYFSFRINKTRTKKKTLYNI
eukprot:GEMP01130566.1.p1 GENE.GEMP01130566.1~~GEMP01130566.1.p1  ORF type:complete len:104 (-),score=1.30 GEMP01130566.1:172-483(-)